MKSSLRIAAFATAAMFALGAASVIAKPARDSAPTTTAWVCTTQGFDGTQTNLIQTGYAAGNDATAIATMYGYNVDNVQACITANGG